MDESKNGTLVMARNQLHKVLIYKLYQPLYQGIRYIWNEAKKTSRSDNLYERFQNMCTLVPRWNQDLIDKEYKRIIAKTECEWLDKLIEKIFLVDTEILRVHNNSKIKLPIPKPEKFIHHCYKECARAFYSRPWLMEDRSKMSSRIEQAKNLDRSINLIEKAIEDTIRNMLPIETLVMSNTEEPVPEIHLVANSQFDTSLPLFPLQSAPLQSAPLQPAASLQSAPLQSFADSPRSPSPPARLEVEVHNEPAKQIENKVEDTIVSNFDPESLFERIEEPAAPVDDFIHLHNDDPVPTVDAKVVTTSHTEQNLKDDNQKENDTKVIFLDSGSYNKKPHSKQESDTLTLSDKDDKVEDDLPTFRKKTEDKGKINLDVMSTDDFVSSEKVPPIENFDALNFFDD